MVTMKLDVVEHHPAATEKVKCNGGTCGVCGLPAWSLAGSGVDANLDAEHRSRRRCCPSSVRFVNHRRLLAGPQPPGPGTQSSSGPG